MRKKKCTAIIQGIRNPELLQWFFCRMELHCHWSRVETIDTYKVYRCLKYINAAGQVLHIHCSCSRFSSRYEL